MPGMLKLLPLLLPVINKARRDPRVAEALSKALKRKPKPGTTGRKP